MIFSPQDDRRSVSWAPVWKDGVLSLTLLVLCFRLCLYGECQIVVSLHLLTGSERRSCMVLIINDALKCGKSAYRFQACKRGSYHASLATGFPLH